MTWPMTPMRSRTEVIDGALGVVEPTGTASAGAMGTSRTRAPSASTRSRIGSVVSTMSYAVRPTARGSSLRRQRRGVAHDRLLGEGQKRAAVEVVARAFVDQARVDRPA